MTAIEKANFDICIDLLAQYIEKYADKVTEKTSASKIENTHVISKYYQ